MNAIGVIANRDKDIDLKYTRILTDSIISNGGQARLLSDVSKELGLNDGFTTEEEMLDNSDMVICLGGDGTFLKVARKAYIKNLPILGVNLGSLGFLTEIEKKDIDDAVKRLLGDRYTVESRMMLEGSIIRNGEVMANDVALNDIVISRGALSRIVQVKTYVNNEFVDAFPGDGLIISTPTGSTAYSLSAGGPIVDPDVNLIIVTPICPHILYSRSIITTGDRIVKAVVSESFSHEAMVTIDGQEGYSVKGGDAIEVKKSEHSVKVVRIYSRNFFNILRTKIYDRGEDLRKK